MCFGRSSESPIFANTLIMFRITVESKKSILRNRRQPWAYPKDGRLKVYFDGASEAEPRRIMQIIQISTSMLAGVDLEIDYRGHKVSFIHHLREVDIVKITFTDTPLAHSSFDLRISIK